MKVPTTSCSRPQDPLLPGSPGPPGPKRPQPSNSESTKDRLGPSHPRPGCVIFLRGPRSPERDSREHEEPTTTTTELAGETYSPKIFRPKQTRISELKAEAVKKDRRKKLTQSKLVGGAENTAHSRVVAAPEMRQESEQGPCRRHMEAALQELKATPRMVPRAVYLPNCDRKGFYKRKQCKPSRGRKRGICWCVDKYGMKLPGMEYVDGGFQCHAFDSSNVE
ncbi:Insulin-like growth factor-binding protein 5 [Saguinus oedipus]|uniref:Insulin-like growth factor-binding protein 5 n=1 Tax=Saguinus oedipus TaxID=9490 RepID=A0ABQ9VGL4_SAGOE|nr:Insulin-like growth factor-binding protein 5 [Saguinus oedipus]